jgi:hypothetical protein
MGTPRKKREKLEVEGDVRLWRRIKGGGIRIYIDTAVIVSKVNPSETVAFWSIPNEEVQKRTQGIRFRAPNRTKLMAAISARG